MTKLRTREMDRELKGCVKGHARKKDPTREGGVWGTRPYKNKRRADLKVGHYKWRQEPKTPRAKPARGAPGE